MGNHTAFCSFILLLLQLVINRSINGDFNMNAKKKVHNDLDDDSAVELDSTEESDTKPEPRVTRKAEVQAARKEADENPVTMKLLIKMLVDSGMSVYEICKWTGLSPTIFESDIVEPRVKIKLNKLAVRQGIGVEL